MNKHTLIVSIAVILIAIPFLISFWNIYSANNLQIRWHEPKTFSFFELSNNGKISVCNSLPFHVGFNSMSITIFFKEQNMGTWSAEGVTIPANSVKHIEGVFKTDTYSQTQYTFLHMDSQFDGAVPVRLDPRTLVVVTDIQTPIIGIIPYSVSSQHAGFDFDKMMNSDADFC